jgi:N-acetyl-alpha-D-muramate 1-phosphate uridylyltransferase
MASPPPGLPQRAMVLAAGLGQRMRPLTLTVPKPLIQVGGRTMLDHALDRLADAGVAEAVVNSHWLGQQIADHLAARPAPPQVRLSPEDTLLETAGGIRQALPLLGDDPFFTINADIVWLDGVWLDGPESALHRLARFWDPARMDTLLLLVPTGDAVGYDGRGDYHLDPTGLCRHRGQDATAPFIAGGVSITKPELYRDLPVAPLSNAELWHQAEARGRLYGLIHDGAWFHVGTPEAIPQVDALIRARR